MRAADGDVRGSTSNRQSARPMAFDPRLPGSSIAAQWGGCLAVFMTASLLGGTVMSYTDRIMTGFPGMVRR